MRSVEPSFPYWHTGRYTVACMPEQIDALNAPGVQEQLLRLLNAGGRSGLPLIADFGGTAFCDGSAINLLVRVHTRACALRRRMYAAVPPRGTARRVFQATGIHRLIPTYPDLASAISVATSDGPPGHLREPAGPREPVPG
jgi:anti-anti-sigma regulatory factor